MKILSKDAIKNIILQSISNTYQGQGIANPPIGPGSHIYANADAIATTDAVIQQNIANELSQTSELTATGSNLDAVASTYGVKRKQPSSSIGYVQLPVNSTSTANIYIDTTFQLTDPSGRIYAPTVTGYFAQNSYFQIQSISTGASQNLAQNAILTWRKIPTNALSTVNSITPITGGTDIQSDAELQQFIQLAKRSVPAGSSADFYQYTSQLSPFAGAGFVYPCAQGPGSVHIALTAPASVSTSRTRNITQSTVNLLTQQIQANFPQTANLFVQSSVDNPVDIVFKIQSSTWVDSFPLPLISTSNYVQPCVYTATAPPSAVVNSTAQTITFSSDVNMANHFVSNYSSGSLVVLNSNNQINISTIIPSVPVIPQNINLPQSFSIENSQIIGFSQTGSGPYAITAYLNIALDLNLVIYQNPSLGIIVNSYIFPSNTNTQNYLNQVLQDFGNLGPGEKFTNPTPRLQRYPINPIWNNQITDIFSANLEQQITCSTASISYIYDTVDNGSGTGTPGQKQKYTSPLPVTPINSITSGPYIYTPRTVSFYPISAT